MYAAPGSGAASSTSATASPSGSRAAAERTRKSCQGRNRLAVLRRIKNGFIAAGQTQGPVGLLEQGIRIGAGLYSFSIPNLKIFILNLKFNKLKAVRAVRKPPLLNYLKLRPHTPAIHGLLTLWPSQSKRINELLRSKLRGINWKNPIKRRSKLRGIKPPFGGLKSWRGDFGKLYDAMFHLSTCSIVNKS